MTIIGNPLGAPMSEERKAWAVDCLRVLAQSEEGNDPAVDLGMIQVTICGWLLCDDDGLVSDDQIIEGMGRPDVQAAIHETITTLGREVDARLRASGDHWADRYGVVELDAPEGVTPSDDLVDALLAECGDCNPNLVMRWIGTEPPDAPERAQWHVTFAHDETCPNVERLMRENPDG